MPSRAPRAFSVFVSSRPSCAAEGEGPVGKGWRETTKLIFHRIPIQSPLSLPAQIVQTLIQFLIHSYKEKKWSIQA